MNAKKRANNSRYHLRLARDLARDKLKVMDFADVARKAGGNFQKEDADTKTIQIDYIGKQVSIAKPVMTLAFEPDDWSELGGPIKLKEEIFILHYLTQASGMLPTGNLIPFHSMDGGMTYKSVFRARSVNRLLSAFSNREELLIEIGKCFGGTPGDMGSISLKCRVLPHVELSMVLWKGDDEIPSSGNILFDESVLDYLPTEDCVVMAETVVNRIIHVLNKNTNVGNSSTAAV